MSTDFPWVDQLILNPRAEFTKFINGHVDIGPYTRYDLPDAARAVFYGASQDKRGMAYVAMSLGAIYWLEDQYHNPVCRSDHRKYQCWVNQTQQCFETVSAIELAPVIMYLAGDKERWLKWTETMRLSSCQDPYWAFRRFILGESLDDIPSISPDVTTP